MIGERSRIERIVSGGQTGADRAGLDVGLALGLAVGGWVPKGRWAEDGRVPDHYPNLLECDSADPAARTRCNVRDSDATVILSHGALTGGSALTWEFARREGRPVLHLDLAATGAGSAAALRHWLGDVRPRTLNVAGPRASEDPAVYDAARRVLLEALAGARAGA